MAKRRAIVVRRRTSRRAGIVRSITSAVASTARRPVGMVILLITIAFTINYNADPRHAKNWVITWATKLQAKEAWKWLGDYVVTRSLQVVQSMWLVSVAFLSTNASLATLVATATTALTLSFNATTNWDIVLQSIFLFAVLAVRNPGLKLLAIVAFAIAYVSGHVASQINFQ